VKEIRIDGVIGQGDGEVSASSIRDQLPKNGTDPIRVSFHTEGGSVFEGFAIYDAFDNYSGPKTAAVESSAFSIGSFILTAFDDVEMSPNAYLMLHNPRIGTEGDDDQLSATAGMIGKLKSNMIEAYAKRSGKSAEEISEIMKSETYMNATDAVANGFADRITSKPVNGRPLAHMESMPHGVVTALLGAGSGGNVEPPEEKSMADQQPVAATVQEIKAAFPKAKSDFIVKCIEKSLPLASVATAAAEELMAENEELMAKVAAMEEELQQAKAKAEEEEEAKAKAEAEEEEVAEEEAKATARRSGATPIARATTGKPTASARWSAAVSECVAKCNGNRPKAVSMANKLNPGLRQAYLEEINS